MASPAERPIRPLRPPGARERLGELWAGLQPARLAIRAPALPRATDAARRVVLLPGFGTTDRSLFPLRRYLRAIGHDARGWGIGRQGKDVEDSVERFVPALEALSAADDHRAVLVGWSLGGIVARESARDRPDLVAAVVTLGSPLGGPRHTSAARAYTPAELDAIEALIASRRPDTLSVPVTSIYSRRDGIVDWLSCIDDDTPGAENIEVGSTHVSYGIDPDVWRIVAEKVDAAPH